MHDSPFPSGTLRVVRFRTRSFVFIWGLMCLAGVGCCGPEAGRIEQTQLKRLESFSGYWNVSGRAKTGVDAPFSGEFRGTSNCEFEYESRVFTERFDYVTGPGGGAGEPLARCDGLTILAWERNCKAIVVHQHSSRGDADGIVHWPEDGDALEVHFHYREHPNGRTHAGIVVLTPSGRDKVNWRICRRPLFGPEVVLAEGVAEKPPN